MALLAQIEIERRHHGFPQIKVTFTFDAKGIVHMSASDEGFPNQLHMSKGMRMQLLM